MICSCQLDKSSDCRGELFAGLVHFSVWVFSLEISADRVQRCWTPGQRLNVQSEMWEREQSRIWDEKLRQTQIWLCRVCELFSDVRIGACENLSGLTTQIWLCRVCELLPSSDLVEPLTISQMWELEPVRIENFFENLTKSQIWMCRGCEHSPDLTV